MASSGRSPAPALVVAGGAADDRPLRTTAIPVTSRTGGALFAARSRCSTRRPTSKGPAGRTGGRTTVARGSRRHGRCSALAPRRSLPQRVGRQAAQCRPTLFQCGLCRLRKRLRLAGRLRRGDALPRTPIALPWRSAAARNRASEASGWATESQRGAWRGGRAPTPRRAPGPDRCAGRDREAAHRPAAQQRLVQVPTTPADGARLVATVHARSAALIPAATRLELLRPVDPASRRSAAAPAPVEKEQRASLSAAPPAPAREWCTPASAPPFRSAASIPDRSC
jgi:hypothetical protein